MVYKEVWYVKSRSSKGGHKKRKSSKYPNEARGLCEVLWATQVQQISLNTTKVQQIGIE